MTRPRNRNYKIRPEAEPAIDALKYEIASNLGLQEIIDKYGWVGLSTLDAGNVGGAIQQIINELGQKELVRLYNEGKIKEISYLSKDSVPEKHDLTRTRLLNKVTEVDPQFAQVHQMKPGSPTISNDTGGIDQVKPSIVPSKDGSIEQTKPGEQYH